ILAKERNKRESPLDRAANPLPESPASLACGDVVPHIVVQSPRPRLGAFETHAAKRLLQHYLPLPDSFPSYLKKELLPLWHGVSGLSAYNAFKPISHQIRSDGVGGNAMKKFLVGTVGLVAFGMSAPASAADIAARPRPAPPPMVSPYYDWSGFYIGGNGGWGSSHKCWDVTNFRGPVVPF